MRQQGIIGWRSVQAGSCHAWPLPADATCATVARQVFRDAVSEVGLEPDLLDDCILMASELAANTLHARAVAGPAEGGSVCVRRPGTWEANRFHPPARPRIPRGSRRPPRAPSTAAPNSGSTCAASVPAASSSARCSTTTAAGGTARPSAARVPAQAVTGRGLQIVHELSRGLWGHHPTRARLGGWGVRGKAVWCRSGVISLTSTEGDRERWSYADLVEAAEQTVRRYEELELGLDLAVAEA
jgi:hypothetical protein